MIPILCVDDRGGVMFNHRRLSRDRLLRRHLLDMLAGKTLWMSRYSREQFTETSAAHLVVDEDFLSLAGSGEYCFVEGSPLLPHLARIEGLILFRWNRRYPADTFLDLSPADPPWHLVEQMDFPGSSHQILTKEVYTR